MGTITAILAVLLGDRVAIRCYRADPCMCCRIFARNGYS
jgi:hypothetical protein